MESSATNKWTILPLTSLLLISFVGVAMRYKIEFPFPFLVQKNLQHAHSHFAFAGWVSQLLMYLMVRLISGSLSGKRVKQYETILWFNLVTAYGMLITFLIQGYALYSIIFSTASIIVSFVFCGFYFADLKKTKKQTYRNWFFAALLFNILSSLGTFVLVYMMAIKIVDQHGYLASVYWYLHFQYNGWFLFACLGLLIHYIKTVAPAINISNNIFWLFACSCVPAYGLSVLWAHLPIAIYAIVVVAAIAQFYAWLLLLTALKNISFSRLRLPAIGKYILWFLAAAFSIKISLQLVSVIPFISKLAFGFRAVVIAYLHLVLLAITSVFLIAYCYLNSLLRVTKTTNIGIALFLFGVFMNELILAIQGIFSFGYVVVPFVKPLLLAVSMLIFFSILLIIVAQLKTEKQSLI